MLMSQTSTLTRCLSLCALFLMEAAKRADSDFHVPPPSTSHTIRDSASDINKMRAYVHEKEVNREVAQHTSSPFIDPTDSGFKIMCKPAWIEGILKEEQSEEQEIQNEVSLDYELSDTV